MRFTVERIHCSHLKLKIDSIVLYVYKGFFFIARSLSIIFHSLNCFFLCFVFISLLFCFISFVIRSTLKSKTKTTTGMHKRSGGSEDGTN